MSFNGVRLRTIDEDAGHAAGVLHRMVAEKLRPATFQESSILGTDGAFVTLPALPRPFPLFLQFGVEAVHVQAHGLFIRNFLCEIERKTVRVVEFEYFDSRNHVLTGLCRLLDDFFKSLQADGYHRR